MLTETKPWDPLININYFIIFVELYKGKQKHTEFKTPNNVPKLNDLFSTSLVNYERQVINVQILRIQQMGGCYTQA